MVASASPLMANHQWKGVVRSRESFKFWWALTISLEWLIVSGAVNLSPVHTSNNVEAALSKQQATLLPIASTMLLFWATMSKQHSTMLLRQCCWCGPGLTWAAEAETAEDMWAAAYPTSAETEAAGRFSWAGSRKYHSDIITDSGQWLSARSRSRYTQTKCFAVENWLWFVTSAASWLDFRGGIGRT